MHYLSVLIVIGAVIVFAEELMTCITSIVSLSLSVCVYIISFFKVAQTEFVHKSGVCNTCKEHMIAKVCLVVSQQLKGKVTGII